MAPTIRRPFDDDYQTHPTWVAWSDQIEPGLQKERSVATEALTAALKQLGDPVDDALARITGDEFVDMVWQLEPRARRRGLQQLGVPSARRPTGAAGGMGLANLRRKSPQERDHILVHLTFAAAERLAAAWWEPAGDNRDREQALLEAMLAARGYTNGIRLIALTRCKGTNAMTVALRLALENGLALPGWPQSGVTDVIAACRRLEQVWQRIDEAQPDDARSDQASDASDAADHLDGSDDGSVDDAGPVMDHAGAEPEPTGGPFGRDVLAEGTPQSPAAARSASPAELATSAPAPADARPATAPEGRPSMTFLEPGEPFADAAAEFVRLAELIEQQHTTATHTARDLAAVLEADGLPAAGASEPITRLTATVSGARALLADHEQPLPADATIHSLIEVLRAAAETVGRDDPRARIATLAALTGTDDLSAQIEQAAALAVTLAGTSDWTDLQQQHADGLLALLDIVAAAAAGDTPAVMAAHPTAQQNLPAELTQLTYEAIFGKLSITAPEPSSNPAARPPRSPEPVGAPTTSHSRGEQHPTELVEPEGSAEVAAEPMVTSEEHGNDVISTGSESVAEAGVLSAEEPEGEDDAGLLDDDLLGEQSEPPAGRNDHSGGSAADTEAGRDLVRDLLGQGNLGLAYHAAFACEDYRRADALRVFAVAETIRNETSPAATLVHAALERGQKTAPVTDPPAQLLLFAAAVRSCLAAADAVAGETVVELSHLMANLPALAELGTTIGEASTHGWLYSTDVLSALAPIAGADNDIAATVDAAAAELRRPRNVEFPRANQIIERWWSSSGTVGKHLDAAAHDRRGQAEQVAEDLRKLAKNLDGQLSRADETLRSSGRPLQGSVRRRLKTMAELSIQTVATWVDAVRANQRTGRAAPAPAHLTSLRQQVKQQWPAAETELTEMATGAPGSLAAEAAAAGRDSLRRSVGMLLDGTPLGGTDRDPDLVLNQDLLRSRDLPIDSDGLPARLVTIDDVAAAAAIGWEDAFTTRLINEEFATAARIIDTAAGPDSAGMRDRLAAATAASRSQLQTLRRQVEEAVARAARLGQLDEIATSTVTGQLEAADLSPDPDGRPRNLRTARNLLTAIEADLPQYRQQAQEAMRRRVNAEQDIPDGPEGAAMRAAIHERIDDGDLATAEEYLLAAVNGETPPSAEPSDDLTQFLDLIPALPAGITRELVTTAQAGETAAGLAFGELSATDRTAAADGLQAAIDMRGERPGELSRTAVAAVLRLAGLEFTAMRPLPELPAGARRTWRELAGVTRAGNALSPKFGSLAGERQRILICWGDVDVRTMFGWLSQDNSESPVLVLLLAPMPREQRAALAVECAEKPEKPVLVLDDVALAHLAVRGAGQFAAMERILLPFAATNPYLPDANAAVPSEMFYGRSQERSQIIDSHGPNLLYGGRQLGKTALLQAASRRFMQGQTGNRAAIYVVMPNVVGVGVNPATLWDRIADKLTELQIPAAKTRSKDPREKVVATIQAWLAGDSTRRMLLLIDECDEFFNADAAGRGFANVTALRDLRDRTDRRFKPVFAGLHQVQRFSRLPNQPLAGAHFGDQLAIGPLGPEPAYRLLFTPMEALGIRFKAPELAHRILAYCNYQPKLLQMVGEALVAELLRRRQTGPPYVIEERDLDRVLGSADLQRRVRQTVHLTLDLDPRYKLIALMVALAAYEHGADHTMTMSALRKECDRWWPDGFAGQGSDEFGSLLEEMRELGVLTGIGGRWRLRSANVLRLLGSAAEIDDQLVSDQWDTVPTQLSAEQARRPITGGRVAPCTEQQLSRLTGRGNTIRVVVGSPASGVARVRELLEAAKDSGARFDLAIARTNAAYSKQLRTGDPGGEHRVVFSDLTGAKTDSVVAALSQAERVQPASGVTRTVVLAVDMTAPGVLDAVTGPTALIVADLLVPLRRVSATGLRSWLSDNEPMQVFRDVSSHTGLLAATGGWPLLLDRAVELAGQIGRATRVCEQIAVELGGRDPALEFLEATGLRAETRLEAAFEQLVAYDDPVSDDDLIELCADHGPDAAGTAEALKLLDVLVPAGRDGRWLPEPIVLGAWRTAANG